MLVYAYQVIQKEVKIVAHKTKPIDPEQKYCSPRQAARILGTSEYLIYREAKNDTIPHRKIGERILIPLDWVLQSQ